CSGGLYAFIPVLPLSNPSKKVILFNVPPFIPNDTLERILACYGKLMGPIKMIPLGIKNPQLKHIMSFRRQTYMILNAEFQNMEVAVKLALNGKDYTIFITVDSMKCFTCRKQGHVRQSCPLNMEAEKETEQVNTVVENDAAESTDIRKPKLEKYFPDLELFVESGAVAMRKATLEELDQPKRYRLKKLVSVVRKSLNSRLKKH
uniref:CCHC-type domain-containing protein n=1 Tax=Sinocyclocheilus grahami TaxID=75366 RepID=A0A672N691_SINGR